MDRSRGMDQNREQLSLGQRWSHARPTKTLVFWSWVATAVVTMIIGFSWGGWVTGGTAPICVVQSGRDPAKAVKLVALKAESSWQRGEYIGKQGWATMPGEQEPDGKVAEACATLLLPIS